MSLLAITGDVLGCGKTLAMVYYGLRNMHIHKRVVYSNFPVNFKVNGRIVGKAKMIKEPMEITKLKNGAFLGDELWAWLDSRNFGKKSNIVKSKILLSSRKKELHIFYTAQGLDQMEKRVRNITDFEAVPTITANKEWCIVTVYQLSRSKRVRVIKKFKFKAKPIFDMYDTNYIIDFGDD